METIGARELQQHASAALRRVERGQMLGVTVRGRLVAVLAPPSAVGGIAALEAAGRVRRAVAGARQQPGKTVVSSVTTESLLDELRAES